MAGASGHSTVYRRSRVTAARKLRFVEQPRLHAGQPDRRLAFNIDVHEQAYAVFLGGEANRATLGIRFSCLFPRASSKIFCPNGWPDDRPNPASGHRRSERGGGLRKQYAKESAGRTARHLRLGSTLLADLAGSGKLKVVAAIYDLETGVVTYID
jgi:hypothetical protein